MASCLSSTSAKAKAHGDERLAVLFADVVNSADVGMVQGRGRFGFAAETLQGLRILGQIAWKKFQGDETAKAGVFRFIDDTIPPPPSLSIMR
jgi:hypothetical protein